MFFSFPDTATITEHIMAKKRTTGIEWTEHTWNPFVGCTIHTPGCTNCYAMQMAARIVEMKTTPSYNGTVRKVNGKAVWTGIVNKSTPSVWRKPYTVKDPSIFFVNSMSDFFHEHAEDAWRLEAMSVMAATPHQYQVLTKRPENILPFIGRTRAEFPSNMWVGATVERGDFTHRIDTLRDVPAQIRFLSVEPLIGPPGRLNLQGIHWVIGGGESGPGARGMEADWLRAVRDQCQAQGVPFFFKQWGIARNNPLWHEARAGGATEAQAAAYVEEHDPIGKGGSMVDGREWKEYPAFTERPPQRPLL